MSARLRTSALLLFLPLLVACAIRGWTLNEPYDRGATITLESDSSSLTGELLLVDDDGVTVLANNTLTRAVWAVLRDLEVKGRPAPRLRNGRTPSTDEIRELQLTSRHPFGLTDAQWSRLRDAWGWDTIYEFR
ncbi:MAG: hypothetical protein HKN73_05565 [Gemmatimonadetes bacterium]|nr:hypothetical protein [Gemmatimonadota bacterium]